MDGIAVRPLTAADVPACAASQSSTVLRVALQREAHATLPTAQATHTSEQRREGIEKIVVRPLTAADVPACVALQKRTFPPELWEDEKEYETLRSSHGLSVAWGSCHTAYCAGNPHERPACEQREHERTESMSVAIVSEGGFSGYAKPGHVSGYLMAHWTDGDISELSQGHYPPRTPEMTTICIHDFVLDPTLQGRGIGRHVVCSVLFPQWRAAGARDVCLLSVPEAIGFWHRLGFETVREYMPKAHGDGGGNTGPAYPAGSLVMRRALSSTT